MEDDLIRQLYDPLPELPARLVGGKAHGRVLNVVDPLGLNQRINVPVGVAKVGFFTGEVIEHERAFYRLDRLSEDDHHWIYVWEGIG